MDNNKKGILCFGELVADCFGNVKEGFVPKFGGAPGNTSIGLKKLGCGKVFMHAMVGKDMFGDFLIDTLSSSGVDVLCVSNHEKEKTTLAFVSLSEYGQRDFAFYEGAHPHVNDSLLNESHFEDSAFFHFGSLTQSTEEGNKVTMNAVELAHKNNCLVSYDPNVREALWEDLDRLRDIILGTIPYVDVLKVNEEEALFFTGEEDPKLAADKLWKDNLQLLVITLGAKGMWYKTKDNEGAIDTISVDVVDTTGAGDACNAGVLYGLWKNNKNIEEFSKEELESLLRFAVAFASLSTTSKGAVDNIPTEEEVLERLR